MKQAKIQTIYQPLCIAPIQSIKKRLKKLDFEFMDIDILPSSLRSTLRDILEVGNGAPFRSYYQWTSTSVYEYAKKKNIKEIVELGAGCAPITKHLIKKFPQWEMKFKITDLNPDVANFKNVENADTRVTAIYEPIDFTKKTQGFENSLLVLSATFHHVDEKLKRSILTNLKALSPHVMIFEPLRPALTSYIFVLGALVSGFLTPLFKINTNKFIRNLIWCWLIPIAPFLFLWDGWVSAFRCWSKSKWQSQEPQAEIEETLFCTKILLTK